MIADLNSTQEEYLNDVHQSSKHLLSLINDILDLAKVEAGKLELSPSVVNPRVLMGNSINMIKEKAIAHDVRISLETDGIPEIIIADEKRLKQVFYNLLSNVMKFTLDGGEVKLSASYLSTENKALKSKKSNHVQWIDTDGGRGENHENLIEFSVSDTGIGVKPEDRERIFGRFEQADSPMTKRFQGTGLGLPMARSLVELHHGRL